MLDGKVKYIRSRKDFTDGYVLREGDGEVSFEKYHSDGKCEVLMVFEGCSLDQEFSWNICMQGARQVVGKTSTVIYICLEPWNAVEKT